MLRSTIISLLAIFLLFACNNNENKKPKDDKVADTLNTEVPADTTLDDDFEGGLMPPMSEFLPEVIVLLEEVEQKYHPHLLDTTIDINIYKDEVKKAMNLGIYNTDLMYSCMNHDTTYNRRYVKTINTFANQLNVTKSNDKLLHFNHNADTLLYDIIQQLNHDKYHEYFAIEKNKIEYSFLVSMGAWVEYLHISCQIYKETPSEKLKKQIAEQKIYLSNLSMYISFYDDNEIIAQFKDDFDKLLDAYNKVVIDYEYQEPTVDLVDDVIVANQNDVVKITITKEEIDFIASEIEKIRKIIIHPDKM